MASCKGLRGGTGSASVWRSDAVKPKESGAFVYLGRAFTGALGLGTASQLPRFSSVPVSARTRMHG